MLGRIFGLLAALATYLCIGTVIAQGIALYWLSQQGMLDRDRVVKAVAILQGVDLVSIQREMESQRETVKPAQVSLDDVALARARLERDLELREQAAATQLDQVRFERGELAVQNSQYQQVASQFRQQLDALRGEVILENQEEARLILENIKPTQAKEQLMLMVNSGEMREAVVLLAAMPVTKQAKLVAEFKTPDESATLAEMLRLIREGEPEMSVIDQAERGLQSMNPRGAANAAQTASTGRPTQ